VVVAGDLVHRLGVDFGVSLGLALSEHLARLAIHDAAQVAGVDDDSASGENL
jgi:hypothetical protein